MVFVGKPTVFSTVILGLHSLLYPFKWTSPLVPVLPRALVGMLEAPMPILVGITKKEYEMIHDEVLSAEEMEEKTWVFLDKGEIIWSWDVQQVPTIDFNNLQHRTKTDYE